MGLGTGEGSSRIENSEGQIWKRLSSNSGGGRGSSGGSSSGDGSSWGGGSSSGDGSSSRGGGGGIIIIIIICTKMYFAACNVGLINEFLQNAQYTILTLGL
jgi:hypothetical protein